MPNLPAHPLAILALARFEMNTFNPLSLLKKLLEIEGYEQPVDFRHSTAIDKELKQLIDRAKAGGQVHVPKELQIEAVQRFWRTKQLTSFRDARLVSFGLGLDVGKDGRSLLEDEKLFSTVLDEMGQWRNSPRQFRKCYQGLVRSYFEYDGMAPKADAVGRKNWLLLRAYLQQNLPCIQDKKSINPEWVDCALKNSNLFTDNPAQAYGQELLQNNTDRIENIRQLIGITDTSWFTRALVIGQIKAAKEQSNSNFQNLVTKLLQLIEENEFLRNHGLRLILEHYAKIPNAPQHLGLKQCAVQWWGNPWLSSNANQWGFDTLKKAREMVSNWLKKEFIHLFFMKLAEDGLSDTRRLRFWEKYAESVDAMFFALGSYARQSNDPDFIEIRKKLDGLIANLEGSGKTNNAFIMYIGNLIIVEFSSINNALYGYDKTKNPPFDLSKLLISPVNGENSLKNKNYCNLYLTHKDNFSPYSNWEDRFEHELQKNNIFPEIKFVVDAIGTDYKPINKKIISSAAGNKKSISSSYPKQKTYDLFEKEKPSAIEKSQPFSVENLIILAKKIDGNIKDNTDKGGALWISAKEYNSEANIKLKQWGFTYSDGKGWWRK